MIVARRARAAHPARTRRRRRARDRRRADAGADPQPARRPGPAGRQRRRGGRGRDRDRRCSGSPARPRTCGSRSSAPRSPRWPSTRSARRVAAARRRCGWRWPGTAITAALTALVYADRAHATTGCSQQYNLWSVGSLTGRGTRGAGGDRAVHGPRRCWSRCCWRGRSTRSRSATTRARALGAHVGRTRSAGAGAITLLCGAATAAAGPIYFLGLTVPHAARAIVRPRPALDARLLRRARRRRCCSRRRARPRARAARASSRSGIVLAVRRRARVHRDRPPAADRRPVMPRRRQRAAAHPRPRRPPAGRRCRSGVHVAAGWSSRRCCACLTLALAASPVGTGEFPVAPGDVVAALLGRGRPRARTSSCASCGCRGRCARSRSAARSACPARSSSR